MCEVLIAGGHNNEFRNPYQYALGKLIKLFSVHRSMSNKILLTGIMGDHASRIACNTGEAKSINNFIEYLSEE